MRVQVKEVKVEDLEPGDLFSTAGEDYWDNLDDGSVGEKVYIRTDVPCPEDQVGLKVYKVTVQK